MFQSRRHEKNTHVEHCGIYGDENAQVLIPEKPRAAIMLCNAVAFNSFCTNTENHLTRKKNGNEDGKKREGAQIVIGDFLSGILTFVHSPCIW